MGNKTFDFSSKEKDFFVQKWPNLAQNWHFWSIWVRPCRLIRRPVGGCGPRAVSRKTPIYFIYIEILKIYHLSPSISTPHSSQSILAREVMLKGLPMIFVLMETYPVVVLGTIHPSQQLLFCRWIHLCDPTSDLISIHLVVFTSPNMETIADLDLHHVAALLLAVVIPLPPRQGSRRPMVARGPRLSPVGSRTCQSTCTTKQENQKWHRHSSMRELWL